MRLVRRSSQENGHRYQKFIHSMESIRFSGEQKMRFTSVMAGLLLGTTLTASAQMHPAFAKRGDVAVTYQYLHTNTQPGDCGCFNLSGSGISTSFSLFRSFDAVVEGDAGFATNGPGTGSSLTLMSVVAGGRYALPSLFHGKNAPQLFAEALAGGGHAGGGITGAADGSNAFVGHLGGGFDEYLPAHLSLRLQADWVPTTFVNGSNNRQNNLMIATGIAYHWSRSREK
jgi:hypothetical protein